MNDAGLQQKRLIAALVDIGIAVAASVALVVVFSILGFLVAAVAGGSAASYTSRITTFVVAVGMLAYILGRDAFAAGRSFGKKSQDLKVATAHGGPATLMDSARRNAIFAVGSALLAVASTLQLLPVIGDVLACFISPFLVLGTLAGFGAAVYEVFRIVQDPAGIRFGDELARTKVVRG